MKKVIKIIALVILALLIIAAVAWFGFLKPTPPPISEKDRALLELMPLPSSLVFGDEKFALDQKLSHSFSDVSSSKMEKAIRRFYDQIEKRTELSVDQKEKKNLLINCKKTISGYPSLENDESYKIKISSDQIIIDAATETGVLYALESILQLVKEDNSNWYLPALQMDDQPRYPWRGLMLDLGRHFIPKEVILRTLDGMAAVKMNVLHLHLTEYQGFRIESKTFPKLHEMGSDGQYLKQDEVKEIIDYAADRAIRVIPEFDLPGHATSWFVGHPELASAPGPYVLASKFGILEPLMDPTRESVYTFLDGFFKEMGALFPDEYVHIGGDEVNTKQWKVNPAIQSFMQENELKDPHALQAYFNKRLQKILAKYNKKMMGWDEIMHPDLPKGSIAIQTWRDQKSLWTGIRQGFSGLLSAGYYLDHKRPAAFHYDIDPTVIRGAVTIDIDSTNWNSWDCVLKMRETEFETTLYLFGEAPNLRGIVSMMGNAIGFTDVKKNGDDLIFSHETDFGKVNYDLKMKGDSLFGNASLMVFKLDVKGQHSGSSHSEGGKELPDFTKLDPLTPEEEKLLLGGEACMWSEMVDNQSVESRIWPRAAVIAEKLWSPKELTSDKSDLYRRLIKFDEYLPVLGIDYKSRKKELIAEMVEPQHRQALSKLVELLQEEEFFNRMLIYKPEMTTETPLNRIVDIAAPESYIAYQFSQDVNSWLNEQNEEAKDRILLNLKSWSENYNELLPVFDNDERLKAIESHSKNLSSLSKMALQVMNGQERGQDAKVLIEESQKGQDATLLAVTSALAQLIGTE